MIGFGIAPSSGFSAFQVESSVGEIQARSLVQAARDLDRRLQREIKLEKKARMAKLELRAMNSSHRIRRRRLQTINRLRLQRRDKIACDDDDSK